MSDEFPMAFGRYELVERLAVGGMAELFRARIAGAHGFQKNLVIKRILPHLAEDRSFVDMFIDEAKITASLSHPKIAQVFELGQEDEQLYIVMELVDGFDVLALLRGCAKLRQPLPPSLAVHIAGEVLDALGYAHQATDSDGNFLGIVHRDISPSNVLVSRRGDVKLTDFGIAHAAERQQETQAGTLKGKYGYMSPEQVQGQVLDAQSDLFSVGIVLAEMLMGRRLFTSPNDLDVLLMVRDVDLSRLRKYGDNIATDLRAIIDRSLERDKSKRYRDAREFRDALTTWLQNSKSSVGARELADFVDFMFGKKALKPAGAVPTSYGTLTGPITQRKQQEADAAAQRAREEADMTLESQGSPIVAELDRQGAKARGSAPPGRDAAIDSGTLEGSRTSHDGLRRAEPGSRPRETIDRTGGAKARGSAPPGRNAPVMTNDPPSAAEAPASVASATADARVGDEANRPSQAPDELGDFSKRSPLGLLYRLAVNKETGLLVCEISAITKEIYLAGGVPQYVSSNVARELLGEYLLAHKVISQGELAMALAMMPHFGGKLGDTLVGLGLMKPLDVFRLLSRQVRDKIVDVCTWQKGVYRFFRGRTNPREAFPLGLDAFEVLGAGATAIAEATMQTWAQAVAQRRPVVTPSPRVVPEAFRLGAFAREVCQQLDGRATVRELLSRIGSTEERLAWLRTLYLLTETDLADFAS